jgi:hypothetical protein
MDVRSVNRRKHQRDLLRQKRRDPEYRKKENFRNMIRMRNRRAWKYDSKSRYVRISKFCKTCGAKIPCGTSQQYCVECRPSNAVRSNRVLFKHCQKCNQLFCARRHDQYLCKEHRNDRKVYYINYRCARGHRPLAEYRAMLAATKLPREERLRRLRVKNAQYRYARGGLTWQEFSRRREEKKQARLTRIAAERAARRAAKPRKTKAEKKERQRVTGKAWRVAHPEYMREYRRNNRAHLNVLKEKYAQTPKGKAMRARYNAIGPKHPRGELQWLKRAKALLRSSLRIRDKLDNGQTLSEFDRSALEIMGIQ